MIKCWGKRVIDKSRNIHLLIDNNMLVTSWGGGADVVSEICVGD